MEITRITEQNIFAFEDLMPEELWRQGERLLLGAVTDAREAIACMAVDVKQRSLKLDWLYTLPDYREQGAATELLDTLRALVVGMDLKTIETTFDGDRENLDSFLADRGFLVGPNANIYRVPVSDLIYGEEMSWFLETATFTGTVVSLSDDEVCGKVIGLLEEEDMGETAEKMSRELSFARLDKTGTVSGYMIIEEMDEEDIGIVYFVNQGGASAISDFILGLYRRIGTYEYAERYLTFMDLTDGSGIRLIESLTGEDPEEYLTESPLRGVFVLA